MNITRHVSYDVESLERIKYCDSEIVALSGYAFEPPFETFPTTGKHDYNTCENCKSRWKKIYDSLAIKFEKFPNCCSAHSNLLKRADFDKMKFGDLPKLVADKTIFTFQHIINNWNSENWYEEITNYIDYTFQSFGQMPKECGEPFSLTSYMKSVSDYVRSFEKTDKIKVRKVLEYLDSCLSPKDIEPEFNSLIKIYNRWLNLFPFEISFFADLKKEFEDKIPILKGKPVFNPYLGLSKSELQTRNGLIEFLVGRTDSLLRKINVLSLFEQGLIMDGDKVKLELIVNSRKLKIKQGYANLNKDDIDNRFIRLLKDWFADEKRFIDEIMPFLKKGGQKNNRTEGPKSLEDLFVRPELVEPCLEVLRQLDPPQIDQSNNYIGKLKGVIPLWIKVLKSHKGSPLIKQFRDIEYKDVLNANIRGLNLSKDASEFRKSYSKLNDKTIELDMKTILSQLSQMGKLGN